MNDAAADLLPANAPSDHAAHNARMKRMAAVDMFDIPLDLPRFDVRMLWHSRTQNSPAHAWFRELVLECARQV